jgi:hypothetical protein
LVRRGEVFALNWALELPAPPLFNRPALQHTIRKRRHNVFDDVYDNFNTQSSSQWDGLTHFGHREYGFYNGVTAEQITGTEGTRNGIEHWARRGIAGRGVLVDYARFAAAQGSEFKPGERSPITAEQIQAAADWQGVRFETGDILLLRTGWMAWYSALPAEQRAALAQPGAFSACGLDQSEASLRFLWDRHFAAIASDNPSFEAYPPLPTAAGEPGEMLHSTIIGLWGMPIGEMFDLDSLADACRKDGRYECFLTSAPLNKLGGVASPPNALALR